MLFLFSFLQFSLFNGRIPFTTCVKKRNCLYERELRDHVHNSLLVQRLRIFCFCLFSCYISALFSNFGFQVWEKTGFFSKCFEHIYPFGFEKFGVLVLCLDT